MLRRLAAELRARTLGQIQKESKDALLLQGRIASCLVRHVTCVKGNVMFFARGPDSETPRNKTVWVYALREKGEVVALRTLLCTVLCTRSNLSFDRPPSLLHGQRGIAGNTFQTRRDVRCSLSGGERDPATSHYGNRRIRRGPLDVRRRDLRS